MANPPVALNAIKCARIGGPSPDQGVQSDEDLAAIGRQPFTVIACRLPPRFPIVRTGWPPGNVRVIQPVRRSTGASGPAGRSQYCHSTSCPEPE